MQNDNVKNGNEKPGLDTDRISSFFRKNRKGILTAIVLVVILLIGLIVFLTVKDNLDKKAIAAVEELNTEYEGLRYNLTDDTRAGEVNDLLTRLETFGGNKKGYAASRAWSLAADIYTAREDWVKTEEAWLNSAVAGDKTYLGPVAYFQAAIAAEQQYKLEQAIEYLNKCTSHSFEFIDAPRAQFNIGRLYEQLGNKTLAIDAYRALLLNYQWEYDTFNQINLIWHNLARNRIIVLEM